ncbi:MAG TPA: MBL fold metallo-hydrolase, partial [Coriobacteriia bacterium]|nr:MBL fold metallo-hydrolase [Coriobacteriia bacterium]
SLAECGLAATVHHLPGHSPGSICVLTDSGDFFCGDLLTNTRSGPQRNSIIDVAPDYEASLRRLRELPIVTVYPGHGEPFAFDDQPQGARSVVNATR